MVIAFFLYFKRQPSLSRGALHKVALSLKQFAATWGVVKTWHF
jgi:hypothetical protein